MSEPDSSPPIDTLRVRADDGAEADLALTAASSATLGLLWLPALGVAARHYFPFAQALARAGIASAIHEWRGAGSSTLRADREHDWGYRELLELDVPASLAVARERLPSVRWLIGGHSLGAQLAALSLALAPDALEGLTIVAGGAPWWRAFPARERWLVRAAFPFVRGVSALVGHYPGKRLGFGGTEARGVMRDWTKTGATGRYAARGLDVDLEAALGELRRPVLALRLARDALTPRASLAHLLVKMPQAPTMVREIGPDAFASGEASHFSWLREPEPIVRAVVEGYASLGITRGIAAEAAPSEVAATSAHDTANGSGLAPTMVEDIAAPIAPPPKKRRSRAKKAVAKPTGELTP